MTKQAQEKCVRIMCKTAKARGLFAGEVTDSYVQGFCKAAEVYGVDPVELMKVAGWLDDAWNGIKSVGSKAVSGVVNGAKALGNGVLDVGRGVVNGAKMLGNGVLNGSRMIGNGINALSDSMASGLKTVGKAITPNSWHAPMRNMANRMFRNSTLNFGPSGPWARMFGGGAGQTNDLARMGATHGAINGLRALRSMPQGAMPQGAMPQGAMPQGAMPQGAMPQAPAGNAQ